MKFYDGLEEHQAIKLQKGGYIVQLGYSSYKINDVVAYGQRQQVFVSDLDSVKKHTPERKKEIAAIISDGSEVPVDVVNSYKDKYAMYWDDDEEDYVFGDDTDAEIEYLKDVVKYRVKEYIYEVVPAKDEPIEIQIVGVVEDTGSDFIETPFVYGKTSFDRTGIYKVLLSKIALDEFLKLQVKYKDVDFNLPEHGHLNYAKVNGSYIFTGYEKPWVNRSDKYLIVNDLGEAKEKEERVRKFVRDRVRMYAEPKQADKIEIKDFVERLESIRLDLIDLDVKKSSDFKHSGLLAKINNLIDKYSSM